MIEKAGGSGDFIAVSLGYATRLAPYKLQEFCLYVPRPPPLKYTGLEVVRFETLPAPPVIGKSGAKPRQVT
jgi:hypothetical protein